MEGVPFAGTRRGIAGVRDFFAAVSDGLDVLEFEPHEYIAQGDKVVALGRYSWRVKATGREFSSDFATCARFASTSTWTPRPKFAPTRSVDGVPDLGHSGSTGPAAPAPRVS
jgi:hypothetical protein